MMSGSTVSLRVLVTYLVFLFVTTLGCSVFRPDTLTQSLYFIDHLEMIRHPENPAFQAVKLGHVFRNVVEFPNNKEIRLEFPVFPDTARFRYAIGYDSMGTLPDKIETAISVEIPGEDIFEFAPNIYRPEEMKGWFQSNIDLSAFTGQNIVVSLKVTHDTGDEIIYLGDPRIEIPEPDSPKRIILICIDTLRADILGSYGNTKGLSPNLDALAEESVLFTNCQSAAPHTFPSCIATLTSRYPGMIQGLLGEDRTRDEEILLSEVFHDAGFRTSSLIANVHLSEEFGFFQGYDYQLEKLSGTATEIIDNAISWIKGNSDLDFFLYLHLNDVHAPYTPPEPYLTRFKMGSGRYEEGFNTHVNDIRDGIIEVTESEKLQLRGLYEAEFAYTDSELGNLFEFLKQLGIWNETAVVVYADHGEEFWDHDSCGHSLTLYQELTHVPLIMKIPGIDPEIRTDTVGLLDIFPTAVKWSGLENPPTVLGKDLFANDYDLEARRTFLSETNSNGMALKSLVEKEWKLILDFNSDDIPMFFNLDEDPDEHENIFMEEPELVEKLASELALYAMQLSLGYNLFFLPAGRNRDDTYILTVNTEDGLITDPVCSLRGGTISPEVTENMIMYEINFVNRRKRPLFLNFSVEPEDSIARFKIMNVDEPGMLFSWFTGDSNESFMANEFSAAMTDPAVVIPMPDMSREREPGVYIWSVPPSIMTDFTETLSPEALEELRALGYIQ